MGTGSFPGVNRPGLGVEHPPPYIAEVKEIVELYLCSSSEPSWPNRRQTLNFCLTFFRLLTESSILDPCYEVWVQIG